MFSIELASWSGHRQLDWIKRTGFSEDEIALELDSSYHAARAHVTYNEGEEFPEFLDEGVQDILKLITELIDAEPGLWSPESMRTAEQWEVVRARARRLLEEIRASSWAQFLER